MTVAIVGLGNIGTVFAAHLAAAGRHRVFACVRHKPERVVVEGGFGQVAAELESFDNEAAVPQADWILLTTKTQQTANAAGWLARLIRPGSRLVVLQNGVDAEARLQPFRGEATVIPTVVYTNAKRLGEWRVRHMRPGADIGLPDGEDARGVLQLFEGSQLVAQMEPDFTTAAWRKFLINLVANPLTAITGQGIGVLREPEMEQLALRLLAEAAQVGRAEGAQLGPDAPAQVLAWLKNFPAETGTSMLEDRQAGRALEYEALTGTALRFGERHGIPMPENRSLLALLRGLSEVGRSTS